MFQPHDPRATSNALTSSTSTCQQVALLLGAQAVAVSLAMSAVLAQGRDNRPAARARDFLSGMTRLSTTLVHVGRGVTPRLAETSWKKLHTTSTLALLWVRADQAEPASRPCSELPCACREKHSDYSTP